MQLAELVVRRIVAINRINRPSGVYTIHNRALSVLSYKFDGHTVYSQNGNEHILDSAHIVLVPAGASYVYRCQEHGECILLEFEADLANQDSQLCSYKIQNTAEISSLINRLEHAFTFKKPGYHPFCVSGLYRLFYHMISQDEDNYGAIAKKKRLQPGLDYLEAHYLDDSLNSQKMATLSNMSDVYFRKLFTEIHGMAPQKYINHIRMTKAKELLHSNELQVQQIATEVGYHDIYSFCKAFRKANGCTPTEYRKRQHAQC